MNEKEYIDANNVLRGKLTPENEAYYDVILLNLRGRMRKNTQIAEDTLLQVLQDLLDAQKVGVAAEDYFGKDAQAVADEIAAGLPNMNLLAFVKEWWQIPFAYAMGPIILDIVLQLGSKVIYGRGVIDLLRFVNYFGIGMIFGPAMIAAVYVLVRENANKRLRGAIVGILFAGSVGALWFFGSYIPWHWYVNF